MDMDISTPIIAVMDREVEIALNAIGLKGKEAMQGELINSDGGIDSERLLNGISYATKNTQYGAGGVGQEEDLPPKPEDKYTVNIGTRVPYAKYVNYGSLPYGRGTEGPAIQEGSFIERITAWVESKLGLSGEEGLRVANRIYHAIANNGTDVRPFFEPSFPKIEMATKTATQEMAKRLELNIKPVTFTITPNGQVKKNTKAGVK